MALLLVSTGITVCAFKFTASIKMPAVHSTANLYPDIFIFILKNFIVMACNVVNWFTSKYAQIQLQKIRCHVEKIRIYAKYNQILHYCADISRRQQQYILVSNETGNPSNHTFILKDFPFENITEVTVAQHASVGIYFDAASYQHIIP